jgi:hypothetical protein
MTRIHNYSQYVPTTDTINVISFPESRSLEQAALFIMKMNVDVREYGCIYFLTEQSQTKENRDETN